MRLPFSQIERLAGNVLSKLFSLNAPINFLFAQVDVRTYLYSAPRLPVLLWNTGSRYALPSLEILILTYRSLPESYRIGQVPIEYFLHQVVYEKAKTISLFLAPLFLSFISPSLSSLYLLS
jgi:hypothetical protein